MKNSSKPRGEDEEWKEREGEEEETTVEEAEARETRGARERVHRGRLAEEGEAESATELHAARAAVDAAAEERRRDGAAARRSAWEAARCIIAETERADGTVCRGRRKNLRATPAQR